MKDMMFEEFQKYAKEVFGYDVIRDTSKSETFEELFKCSFIDRDKEYELPESYPDLVETGIYSVNNDSLYQIIIQGISEINLSEDSTYEDSSDICIAA